MNVRRILSILGILLLIVLVGAPSPRPADAQSEGEYGIMPLVLVNLSRTIAVDSQLAVSESNAVWVSGEGEAAEILLSDLWPPLPARSRCPSGRPSRFAAPWGAMKSIASTSAGGWGSLRKPGIWTYLAPPP